MDPVRIAGEVERRTGAVVAALGALDDAALLAPSTLPGWSRLTVAAHLRYGAEALAWMTDDTLAGRPTAYYPTGRATQRPGTLGPRVGESPADVVTGLRDASSALAARWAALAPADWDRAMIEPDDNPDLGPLSLRALAVLRLTEVEVHGTDLDLSLADWSPTFVEAALPLRIARLAGRRAAVDADDTDAAMAWHLVPSDLSAEATSATPDPEPAPPGDTLAGVPVATEAGGAHGRSYLVTVGLDGLATVTTIGPATAAAGAGRGTVSGMVEVTAVADVDTTTRSDANAATATTTPAATEAATARADTRTAGTATADTRSAGTATADTRSAGTATADTRSAGTATADTGTAGTTPAPTESATPRADTEADVTAAITSTAARAAPATVDTIVGTSRDLVALLLGRPAREQLGPDPAAVASFARAFPGP